MNDLTPHQRDILIAMLQGREVEFLPVLAWVPSKPMDTLLRLTACPHKLRIAPNQDEAVRLYCAEPGTELNNEFLLTPKPLPGYDTHYIDISPNGFIVGGKIEDIAK